MSTWKAKLRGILRAGVLPNGAARVKAMIELHKRSDDTFALCPDRPANDPRPLPAGTYATPYWCVEIDDVGALGEGVANPYEDPDAAGFSHYAAAQIFRCDCPDETVRALADILALVITNAPALIDLLSDLEGN